MLDNQIMGEFYRTRGITIMKKRGILFGVMVLAMSAALGACQGDKTTESSEAVNDSSENADETAAQTDAEAAQDVSSGDPVQGGNVVFGITQDLVSLDPHTTTDAGTRSVVFNLYEGLVKPTSGGDLEPAVAESYVISEDAKTYTFTLRDGVTFHDGSEVTAEDVKYSIERYAESQGESSAFSNVESVEIVDENTVEITLSEGYSEFLTDVASACIIPESNDDPAGNPIGTGPFKYVSYTPGQSLKLEKYEGYWKEGYPYLDTAEFKIIANANTAYTELQAGTLDMLNYLTTDQVNALSDDFEIVEGSMMLVQGMFLNNAYEPLQDVRVRQAICYAVDRQTVNDFLFDGKSHLVGTHMIPSLEKYYNEETENVYSYDPEKAKELLSEAGYEDGFDLVITIPSNYDQHVQTGEIIVEQLQQVGINATINAVEWETWLSDVYNGKDYQATIIGFDGTLAPSDWLKKYTSTSSKNFVNFSSEAYDEAYEKAYTTVDDTEKAQYYKECEMILAEEAASVYIQDPANFVAVKAGIEGFEFYPVAAYDLSTVYYTE